jgi:uncharacterized protein (DUF488 family)
MQLPIPQNILEKAEIKAKATGLSIESILLDWLRREAGVLSLYTIGHSNLTAEEFLDLLKKHAITVLVDVRSAPYSRYVSQFNKEELKLFLEAHGVGYRFAGQHLGGRPKDADDYKDGQIPDEDTARQKYLKLVDYKAMMTREEYQKGIARLLDIIREESQHEGRVTIMCSEGEPQDCHRHHLIARSLLDVHTKIIDNGVDIDVFHIQRDGSLMQATPENFPPETIQERLF